MINISTHLVVFIGIFIVVALSAVLALASDASEDWIDGSTAIFLILLLSFAVFGVYSTWVFFGEGAKP